MSAKKINIAAQRAFGEAVSTGDLDAFDDLVSDACVDHDPAPGQVDGPGGFKALFGAMRAAFPDLRLDVEIMMADSERVASAYTLTGRHQGPFLGHAATGRPVAVRGVQIGRFAGGKLVERWGGADELGIMAQLGLLVGPGPARERGALVLPGPVTGPPRAGE